MKENIRTRLLVIIITALFVLLLTEMLRAETIISADDYKKDYSSDYSYSTDSTILHVMKSDMTRSEKANL